jgi:hypothetical protein
VERVTVVLARELLAEAVRHLNRPSNGLLVRSRWASRVLGRSEVLRERNARAVAEKGNATGSA